MIWSAKCRNTTSYDVVQSKKQENRLKENQETGREDRKVELLIFNKKKRKWKKALTAATFSKIQIEVNTFGGGAIVSHLTIQVK